MFNFKEKLGEGGFGKVYLVEEKESHQNYALKFLRHSFKDVKAVNFLYKEIEILTRLEHRNIVKLYSYFETEENKIALIMEYCSGGTLKKYIAEKGKLTEEEAKRILLQILETISYCHKMDLIHHDLKPDNILFSDESKEKIKLIDFGIASLLKSVNKGGSLQYLPPEIINGKDTRSLPSIDIWAIGCILFEMITGKALFSGKRDEVKKSILMKKIIIPDYVSKEAASLIIEMTRNKPSDRITVEHALQHSFFTGRELTEAELCHCQKYYESEMKKAEEAKSPFDLITNPFSFSPTKQKKSSMKGGILKHTNTIIVTKGVTFAKFSPLKRQRTNIHCLTTKPKKTYSLSCNSNSRSNGNSINNNSLNSTRYNSKYSNRMMSSLPNLITKVTNEVTDEKLYEYNKTLMSKYNGEVPSFLLPIGFTKDQKHLMDKLSNIKSRNTLKTSSKKIRFAASENGFKSPSPIKKRIFLPALTEMKSTRADERSKRYLTLSASKKNGLYIEV